MTMFLQSKNNFQYMKLDKRSDNGQKKKKKKKKREKALIYFHSHCFVELSNITDEFSIFKK